MVPSTRSSMTRTTLGKDPQPITTEPSAMSALKLSKRSQAPTSCNRAGGRDFDRCVDLLPADWPAERRPHSQCWPQKRPRSTFPCSARYMTRLFIVTC